MTDLTVVLATVRQWFVDGLVGKLFFDFMVVGASMWVWRHLGVQYRTLQYQRRWKRAAALVAKRQGQDGDMLETLLLLADSAQIRPEVWEFQESLGRYDLSTEELTDYLRVRGFGKRTWFDRLFRIQRISLDDALRPRSETRPSPLGKALNEIVWRIERRWLFHNPDHRVRPHTGELRITGKAIHRILCQLYGIKETWRIEVHEVETPNAVTPRSVTVHGSIRSDLELPTLTVANGF